jgi:release factor glutamine methyltransferase
VTLVERLRDAGCVFAEEEAALLTQAPDFSDALVQRRIDGEPLEYVLGWASFADRRFAIAPGVFIPRHRTEFLVQSAVEAAPADPVIVDVCCGTGALGLTVLASTGGSLVATDIDPVAVQCAIANGATAVVGDLFDGLPDSLRGTVDVLVANTPYVPTGAIALLPREFRDYEKARTLDGGHDGLELQRRVAAEASRWLAPEGRVYVEVSEEQAPMSAALFEAVGLSAQVLTDDDSTVVVATPNRRKVL